MSLYNLYILIEYSLLIILIKPLFFPVIESNITSGGFNLWRKLIIKASRSNNSKRPLSIQSFIVIPAAIPVDVFSATGFEISNGK